MSKLAVRQHNELIEASYKIASIGEARLVRLLIAQIQPWDEGFKTYQISVSDFAHVFNLNGRDGRLYEMLDHAARSLTSRQITIRNGKSWLHTNWLSSAEYKEGSGYVELCFDAKLKPYLLQLKGFYTDYDLEHLVHFKSAYSIRLFELLQREYKEDAKTGQYRRSFEYDELRQKMGVDNDEYSLFAHFRTRIIEIAVKEINRFSSLNIVQVDYAKTGRKVSHIVFTFEKQRQGSIVLEGGSPHLKEKKEEETPDDVRELVTMGIDEATAYRWRKKYGVKRLTRNIAYTRAMQKASKVKDNPAGYVARAIADDIAKGWEQVEEKKRAELLEQKSKEEEARKAHQEEQDRRFKQVAALIEEFAVLSEPEKQAIRSRYEDSIAFPAMKKVWMSAKEKTGEPEKDTRFSYGFADFFAVYKANLRLPV